MVWEYALTEGMTEEEVDRIIPAYELHHVLAVRLDELKQAYTVQFHNKKTGNMEKLCVWGEENDLYAHEFMTLETLIETTAHLCTRDNLHMRIEFTATDYSPWKAHITQMYPKLWHPDTDEEKDQMEKLTGYTYETIPSAYFADWWIANEKWHRSITCVGDSFVGLQLQMLHAFAKLTYSTELYSKFPPMLVRETTEKKRNIL